MREGILNIPPTDPEEVKKQVEKSLRAGGRKMDNIITKDAEKETSPENRENTGEKSEIQELTRKIEEAERVFKLNRELGMEVSVGEKQRIDAMKRNLEKLREQKDSQKER